MTDPFISAARHMTKGILADLRGAVDGLPGESLDWEPAGEETNSVAVLITHVLNSTRWWVSIAVGAALPDRDRDSEFRVKANDPQALLTWYDDMAAQINGVLESAGDVDWAAVRRDEDEEVPAAWALLHAIEHLREHQAHIGLTRQLWFAR